MEITLTVDRSAVFGEVAQTTNYTGSKMQGDESAYDRISTVDEDLSELSRFWDESRAEVAKALIRNISSETMDGDTYTLRLNVSNAFDTALAPTMQIGLFSFFVQNITARWFVYTNKEEAAAFADRGAALLEDVKEKACYKKRPTRPTYN